MPLPMPSGLMRMPVAIGIAMALLSQMPWWSSPAHAQGFFDQLFGASSSARYRTPQRFGVQQQSVASTPWRIITPSPLYPHESASGYAAPEGSGSYTTVCVRMCDGFFFPISSRVPASRFNRDADACSARCGGSEARLFYHSTKSGSMQDAVDLYGHKYTKLPVAFLHRKKLVNGCSCKPEPWSQASLVRHQGYAMAEGRNTPGSLRDGSSEASSGVGALTVIAGNYDTPPAASRAADETTDEAAGETKTARDTSPPPPADTIDMSTDDQASHVSPGRPAAAFPVRSFGKNRSANGSSGGRPAPRWQPAAAPSRRSNRIGAVAQVPSSRMMWPGDGPIRLR
jgi:hypothetical protein